ncbi:MULTISPECIES: tetratricopeptide repeat protein [Acinetobacter]|jgi:TPR repeat protein|uniref:Localization factor PodJL n=1 Tax=Acinetobacter bereziniae TaxID=106648 RepID=A0A833PF57_ACIBZ|nr:MULTISPECIES: tetratricopeptide repeat protein [Acinetobacter]KAF1024209.1 MAG: Localization factor PodJL [Acinetobacter bereziniae]MCU4316815.1 sel1 repeat family protein [Acinetobacter bereziniae]MDA3441445.1 sel1 repeat family protein [Acinetobacter bereziniae]MDR0238503.1 sel1 repeat family protein [Acinetobacter sp.]
MKKLLLGSTLFFGLLSIQAHADYVPQQQQSVSAMAAQYAHMNVSDLQKAAKAGQPAAQFYLATHFQAGSGGVSKDLKQAFTWFKAAADQGISAAQLNVGRMYADGLGVAKNETTARQYFEKAASHGDNRASFNLAVMEEQKKNYMGAYQWYELSTRDGMLDNKVINMSQSKKTALAANLTQDQIRTATQRADQWIQAQ